MGWMRLPWPSGERQRSAINSPLSSLDIKENLEILIIIFMLIFVNYQFHLLPIQPFVFFCGPVLVQQEAGHLVGLLMFSLSPSACPSHQSQRYFRRSTGAHPSPPPSLPNSPPPSSRFSSIPHSSYCHISPRLLLIFLPVFSRFSYPLPPLT